MNRLQNPHDAAAGTVFKPKAQVLSCIPQKVGITCSYEVRISWWVVEYFAVVGIFYSLNDAGITIAPLTMLHGHFFSGLFGTWSGRKTYIQNLKFDHATLRVLRKQHTIL